ncbi:T9SS type A sorting domain-containing protein [Subsaxibacter sp. CAU 1640]|uniref:T9SS type A sorting domain-containing protein n=1 Tax=Subsaxibacter sp. CAU 1640 TaxID=2933271 RepID=UPI002005B919|nr:T9SS type A sorting domain-containing protein [Subsaxibacter sp. CAU 1640]MCK7590370.1 T9SS type A sorting domain-containing protein [Subsaxibacter sp. CAU 1640]
MSRKLLTLVALLLTQFLIAQSDEAIDATPTQLSATYDCENAEIDDFQGFTKSSEFNCPGSDYDNWIDSWYTFTPTETRVYSIEIEALTGSVQDVRIGIFTGTPGSLNSQTGCATRYYSATLNTGQTYYINTRGASVNTQYRMCVYAFPEQPSNDEPANADTLVISTFDVCENVSVGYTSSATHTNESTCSPSNPDVWYTFTPAATAEYTFKATHLNGSAPLYIGVYSGTPGFLNALSETYPSPTEQCQNIVLADLTGGETYYIGVTSSMSSQAVYFELCAYKSPEPPSNDDCTNPLALTVGQTFEESYIVATNTSATVNASNSNFPDCETLDFSTRGRDVWFTVVVPASGSFTIETRGEPTEDNISDTGMETYTGSCGTSTLIPFYYNLPPPNQGTAYCNGQFVIGGNQFAGIYFTDKTPGELVYVRVWGWSQQFGKFRIGAYDSTLSINEFDLNSFKFYPNPINDQLNIKYNMNITGVVVYDMMGKAIIQEETDSQLVSVSTQNLDAGLYIVTVKSGNESTNFKVVKK